MGVMVGAEVGVEDGAVVGEEVVGEAVGASVVAKVVGEVVGKDVTTAAVVLTPELVGVPYGLKDASVKTLATLLCKTREKLLEAELLVRATLEITVALPLTMLLTVTAEVPTSADTAIWALKLASNSAEKVALSKLEMERPGNVMAEEIVYTVGVAVGAEVGAMVGKKLMATL
eukprot:gene28154-34857_t